MKPARALVPTMAETPLPDKLLSAKDLATALGMSLRWIHERTRRGEIPCYRFGAVLRFDPKEITAWAAKFHHSPEASNGASGRAR